jgi:hypothetical protein
VRGLRSALTAAALVFSGGARLPAADPAPGGGDGLRRAIDAVLARPAYAPAFWGIEVRSLKSGRVV